MNRIKTTRADFCRKITIFFSLVFLCTFPPVSYAQNDTIERLINNLHSEKTWERQRAAKTLGEVNDQRAVDPLIALLKKETENERICSKLLGRPCSTMVMSSPYAPVAAEAAESLGKLNEPRATEHLIAALQFPDPIVRMKSAEALGRMKDTRAIDPLIMALKREPLITKEPANVMSAIYNALWQMGDPAELPLINLLEDKDFRIRLSGAYALMMGITYETINVKRVIRPLVNCYENEVSLYWQANNILLEVLEKAFMKSGSLAVAPLLEAMEKAASKVHYLSALEKIGNRAVEQLIASLDDEDSYFRYNVVGILKQITGEDFGENPRKWRKWWEENK